MFDTQLNINQQPIPLEGVMLTGKGKPYQSTDPSGYKAAWVTLVLLGTILTFAIFYMSQLVHAVYDLINTLGGYLSHV